MVEELRQPTEGDGPKEVPLSPVPLSDHAREALRDLLDERFRGVGKPDNDTIQRITAAEFPDLALPSPNAVKNFCFAVRRRLKAMCAPSPKHDFSMAHVLQAVRIECDKLQPVAQPAKTPEPPKSVEEAAFSGPGLNSNALRARLEEIGMRFSPDNPAWKHFHKAASKALARMRGGRGAHRLVTITHFRTLMAALDDDAVQPQMLSRNMDDFVAMKRFLKILRENENIMASGEPYWPTVDDLPADVLQPTFAVIKTMQRGEIREDLLWIKFRTLLRRLQKNRLGHVVGQHALAQMLEIATQNGTELKLVLASYDRGGTTPRQAAKKGMTH